MAWKGFKDVRATIEIDLNPSLEELWNNLDKDARWGVNRAKKEGLIISEANENEVKEFYTIYELKCKKEKIKQLSLEEYNSGKIEGYPLKVFLAKKEEKIVAGIVIVQDFKNSVLGLYINASVPEFLNFQPNNLLYWYMIEYAKNSGFKKIDLGGYALNAKKGSRLYEINRFKTRWGGRIVEYPVYSKNPFYIIGRKLIRKFPNLKNLISTLSFKKIKIDKRYRK